MILTINVPGECKKIELSTNSNIKASEIHINVEESLGINGTDFYLLQNGKILSSDDIPSSAPISLCFRLLGGKGGFGSMLRAIGAQIEKTTNREACRDLSGRRLRDINEEKRVKAWLDSQKNREEEIADKKKKKIEKLQAKPKHHFKDEAYENARSELTENVTSSVEKGLEIASKNNSETITLGKRKTTEKQSTKKNLKKKKGALWLGDNLSSSSDTDDDDDSNDDNTKSKMVPSSSNTDSSKKSSSNESD